MQCFLSLGAIIGIVIVFLFLIFGIAIVLVSSYALCVCMCRKVNGKENNENNGITTTYVVTSTKL